MNISIHAILLLCLMANTGQAEPVVLSRQMITLPANTGAPLFVDVDGDGSSDLLVIDPVAKTILNYHQRPEGFAGAPDQVVPLPPQTAWVAPCDADAHPGLELLFSTATGLVYSRQDAGLFEAERHSLIEANQVFTNFDFPILTSLATNLTSWGGTNDLIPVISARQAMLYRRNNNYEWNPEPPLAFATERTDWSVDCNPRPDPWSLGSSPSFALRVQQFFQARPDPKRNDEPENETLRKILEDMKKTDKASPPHVDRVDVNDDGRTDLVLWQVTGNLGFKTDIYLFLSGADKKLPERPTQVLHGRGFPIPFGPQYEWSPMHDLNGDGIRELVLLEFKTSITSASGLLETAFSHGLDWSLTIRSFHHNGFPSSPDAAVPVTMVLPAEVLSGWWVFIQGDFNGDGHPDLLVRRSDTQWNLFFSTPDGCGFAPQPAMTFNAPARGHIEINDLNGDRLSDIVWHEPEEHRLSIFMSPPRPAKGKNP
jgi:hypothetical protein